jgi:hypothetical protein
LQIPLPRINNLPPATPRARQAPIRLISPVQAIADTAQPNYPPPFDATAEDPLLPFQASAVSASDKVLIHNFHKALNQIKMEFCSRCQEKWFNIDLSEAGICKKCRAKDEKKAPDEPFYFSAANNLDFGPIPSYLPELSPTEQMMISKVHTFTQVRQVRGAQYRYKGHCVNFARNIAKVFLFLSLFFSLFFPFIY